MAGVLSAFGKAPKNYGDVEFWHTPERTGWLMKQGVRRALHLHCQCTTAAWHRLPQGCDAALPATSDTCCAAYTTTAEQ
jgi:hypothetical protein